MAPGQSYTEGSEDYTEVKEMRNSALRNDTTVQVVHRGGYSERQIGACKSTIQALRDLTLLDFLRLYDHKSYKPGPKAKPRVVSYFPIYSSDPSTGDKYENYCRTKTMLHHSFTDVKDLADIVDDVPSSSAAYRRCQAAHHHEHDALPDAREDDADEEENVRGDKSAGRRRCPAGLGTFGPATSK